jgi:hypothetical protein
LGHCNINFKGKFAFVSYENEKDALAAISALNETELEGNILKVKFASNKPPLNEGKSRSRSPNRSEGHEGKKVVQLVPNPRVQPKIVNLSPAKPALSIPKVVTLGTKPESKSGAEAKIVPGVVLLSPVVGKSGDVVAQTTTSGTKDEAKVDVQKPEIPNPAVQRPEVVQKSEAQKSTVPKPEPQKPEIQRQEAQKPEPQKPKLEEEKARPIKTAVSSLPTPTEQVKATSPASYRPETPKLEVKQDSGVKAAPAKPEVQGVDAGNIKPNPVPKPILPSIKVTEPVRTDQKPVQQVAAPSAQVELKPVLSVPVSAPVPKVAQVAKTEEETKATEDEVPDADGMVSVSGKLDELKCVPCGKTIKKATKKAHLSSKSHAKSREGTKN